MFIGICFSANTQNSTTYDLKMDYGSTWSTYTGQTADTLGISDTVWSWTYWHLNTAHFAQYSLLNLDSLSGSPDSVFVLFQTRLNLSDTWVTDSTIVWMGSSADTTIKYNNSSKRAFPYRRTKILDQDGTFKIGVNKLRQLFLK